MNILIYGDSNVWGDNFITGKRIENDKQWVNILQKSLGSKYNIIQAGLPGRVAGSLEKIKQYKNGKDNFISTFRTFSPLDIVIIALGTNDLQIKYNRKVESIIEDLKWYKKEIEKSFSDLEDKIKYFKNKKMPKIIYIAPIGFDYIDNAKDIFNKESYKKQRELIKKLHEINDIIINPGNLPLFSDGIHLNFEGHKQMADIVRKVILENE